MYYSTDPVYHWESMSFADKPISTDTGRYTFFFRALPHAASRACQEGQRFKRCMCCTTTKVVSPINLAWAPNEPSTATILVHWNCVDSNVYYARFRSGAKPRCFTDFTVNGLKKNALRGQNQYSSDCHENKQTIMNPMSSAAWVS